MSNECKRKYVIKLSSLTAKGEQGEQGPPGPSGPSIELPLSTDDVDYNGSILTDVLDTLLYVPLSIFSFNASPSNYEKGTVLTSIALTWTYNKSVQSQTITGVNVVTPSLLLTDRAKTVALTNISTDTALFLTADDVTADAKPAKVLATALRFYNKIYYGKSYVGTINSAFVLALTGQALQGSKQISFNVTTGVDEYIWVAVPVAYGVPSFKTNGFNGGLSLEATVSITNASGHSESYNIYRSDNHSLGLTAVDVL